MTRLTLKRIARLSAWLLVAAIIVSILSGWGITRTEIIYQASFGLVNRGVANAIHRGLQVPMAAILLVHVLANVKLSLSRYRAGVVNAVLVAIGLALIAVVVYMERT